MSVQDTCGAQQVVMNAAASLWAMTADKLMTSLAWQSFAALAVFLVSLAIERMMGRAPRRYLERSFFIDFHELNGKFFARVPNAGTPMRCRKISMRMTAVPQRL